MKIVWWVPLIKVDMKALFGLEIKLMYHLSIQNNIF